MFYRPWSHYFRNRCIRTTNSCKIFRKYQKYQIVYNGHTFWIGWIIEYSIVPYCFNYHPAEFDNMPKLSYCHELY